MKAGLLVGQTEPVDLGEMYHTSPWETSGFTGTSKWNATQTAASYALTRVTSPVRSGSYALRVEVRSGDVSNNGERAECAHMFHEGTTTEIFENAGSPEKYLALSVYIPTGWITPDPNSGGSAWGIVWQLHSGSGSPPIAFSVARSVNSVSTEGFNLQNRASTSGDYVLSNAVLTRDAWIDFVFRIVFSASAVGSITGWRRDVGETDFTEVLSRTNISTLDHVNNHYWKHGLYRSPSNHTNILHLDCFTLAGTFLGAVQTAFGG